jgi:hypothetical protein
LPEAERVAMSSRWPGLNRRPTVYEIEIKGGKVSYRIVGMPDRDFPKVPIVRARDRFRGADRGGAVAYPGLTGSPRNSSIGAGRWPARTCQRRWDWWSTDPTRASVR